MIVIAYKHQDGHIEVCYWEPSKGEKRPSTDQLQLVEVLQVDVSGEERNYIKTYFSNMPMAPGLYSRYQGDFAKFIWDNYPSRW